LRSFDYTYVCAITANPIDIRRTGLPARQSGASRGASSFNSQPNQFIFNNFIIHPGKTSPCPLRFLPAFGILIESPWNGIEAAAPSGSKSVLVEVAGLLRFCYTEKW
jgi:hypothetical protein